MDRAWVVYLQGNIMLTNNNSLPYSTFLFLRDFERKAVMKLAIISKNTNAFLTQSHAALG